MLVRLVKDVMLPHWPVLIGSVAFMALSTLLNLAPPWLLKILIDDVFLSRSEYMLNVIIFATLLVYIARSVVTFGERYLTHLLGQQIVQDLRTRLHKRLLALENAYFENQQTGKLVSRLVGDVDAIEHLITGGVEQILISCMTLVGIAGILFYMNPSLAVFALIPIPFMLLTMLGFGPQIRKLFHKVREKMADLTARLTDGISGVTVVKSFVRENYEHNWFVQAVKDYFVLNMRAVIAFSAIIPMIGFITGMGAVMILWYGGRQVIAGTLSIGELVAFNTYLTQFYMPIITIVRLVMQLQRSLAAIDRVYDLLDTKPAIADAPSAMAVGAMEGTIEFRNVSFYYEEDKPVLCNVSFRVKPGEMVALVGPSGAGKSTIISLIPRLYDVVDGAIYVDGTDIRDLTLASLRSHIGMVLQDTFLFNGTARDNILYGRLDGSEESMIAAAKAAGIHSYIEALPEGYGTQLGERGVKLSGGQRQRLSIARTILKDPAILILDEATSSVDTEMEVQIQDALERLASDRTTIVIAHRLSTIKNADRIIVLKDGEIVEEGQHEELLEQGALYAHLYQQQFRLHDRRDRGGTTPKAEPQTAATETNDDPGLHLGDGGGLDWR